MDNQKPAINWRRELSRAGISVDDRIQSGQPCISGTRATTRAIASFAVKGARAIKKEYPDLAYRQIADALAFECAARPADDHIRALVEANQSLRDDMLMRAEMNKHAHDGALIVEAGTGVWFRFNEALAAAKDYLGED